MAAGIAGSVIAVYGSYWAFRIGEALPVRVYRTQAFGIGLVSLAFVVLFVTLSLVQSLYGRVNGAVFLFPTLWLFSVLLLYWIDSSARAGRRTDPLLRDSLHWSKARGAVWVAELALVGSGSALYVLSLAQSGGLAALPSTTLGQIAGFLVVFGPVVIAGGVGAALLPLVATRSRDGPMRAHLKWFSAFSLVLLASLLGGVVLDSFLQVDGGYALGPGSILFAYCLYRGAKSLAPLNRIAPESLPTPGPVLHPSSGVASPRGTPLTIATGM